MPLGLPVDPDEYNQKHSVFSYVFSGKVFKTLELIMTLKLLLNSLAVEGKLLSEKINISFLLVSFIS